MADERGGRLLRCAARIRRFTARRRKATFLLCSVGVGLVALSLSLVVHPAASDLVKYGKIVVFLLVPPLSVVTVFCAQRLVRAVRLAFDSRRTTTTPQPVNRPIEEIAAELRRLLWQHHWLARSNDVAPRRRMRALESMITTCAVQGAHALEVRHPEPPATGRLDRLQLCRLLRALAAEGLVLPPTVDLMTLDSRL